MQYKLSKIALLGKGTFIMTMEIMTVSSQIANTDNDARFIDLFIATKKSPKTRTSYRYSIDMLIGVLAKALQDVTLQDAVDYHAWLKGKYTSLHTIKLHMDIAKSLFDFGVDMNYLRTNVMKVIKTDAPGEVTHKRILTEEQTYKLIDAPKRQRDRLLLRLVYAAGLRVSEVCGLVWGDLLANGVLHIRNGKGQKERFVSISEGMIGKLNEHKGNAGAADPIFLSQKGSRLDESQVHRIVKAAAKAAGIDGDASAHWLRHSHASHSLDRGASLVTVRDTLGHSSIATTNKYLHSKRQDSSALYLGV